MPDEPSMEDQPTLQVSGADAEEPTLSEQRTVAIRGPIGTQLVGEAPRFTGLQEIARGGMGAIYRAHDESTGRDVALKVILPDKADEQALSKFVVEARITALLEHPSIVPVHDLTRATDGTIFFTMKLVEGDSLGQLLGRMAKGTLEPWSHHRMLDLFVKICDALAHAHSKGVIHRDLKPGNVMVGAFGEVLVMDWGLAKVIDGDSDMPLAPSGVQSPASATDLAAAPEMTLDGTIMGTPGYMAPEQARGEIDTLDARTDIYALGAMLYGVLTLTPPFRGRTGAQVIDANAAGLVQRPSERAPDRQVPHELEAIVLKAMAPRPDDRYADIGTLRADLVAYLDGRLVAAASYGPLQLASNWLRRNPLITGVAITALLAIAALIAFQVHEQREAAAARAADEARARAAVASLGPEARRAAAMKLLADAPEALRQKRLDPTAAMRSGIDEQIASMRVLANARDELLRRAPGDAQHRKAHLEDLLCIVDLALLGDDYTVAAMLLERAAALEVPGAEAQLKRAHTRLTEGRDRRSADDLRRAKTLLKRASDGQLGAEVDFRAAVVELASLRSQAVVDELAAHLVRVARALDASVRATLLSTADPDEDERNAGWKPLTGLLGAVDRWQAEEAAAAPSALSGEQRAALDEARRRLVVRACKPTHWRAVLASGQRRVFSAAEVDGERALHLTCEALGQLDPASAGPALVRYLRSDFDPRRAIPAGQALARLATDDEACDRALIGLVGQPRASAPRPRFLVRGAWWRAIARSYSPPEGERSAVDWMILAHARFDRGDLAGVKQACDAVLATQPRNVEALAMRGIARRDEQSTADIERAISIDPSSGLAMALLGGRRFFAGKHEEARTLVLRAIRLAPRDAMAHVFAAQVLVKLGETGLASPLLDKAVALDPGSAWILSSRGQVRLFAKRYADALRDFDRAIRLNPANSAYFGHRGEARERLMDREGALADFERALSLRPDSLLRRLQVAAQLMHLGEFDRAERHCRTAIAAKPGVAEGWSLLGHVLLHRRKYAESERAVARALKIKPGNTRGLLVRSQLLARAGKSAAADVDLDKALAKAPREVQLLLRRGRRRLAEGALEQALTNFDSAVKIQPDHPLPVALRGQCHSRRNDLDAAMVDFERAVALAPQSGLILSWRAVCRARRGDVKGALADFDRAVTLEPGNAQIYVLRASLRNRTGDTRGALADVERALKVAPRSVDALAARATTRRISGDHQGALADITRAIEIAPGNPPLLAIRAACYVSMSRLDAGEADVEAALKINPSQPEALRVRAFIRYVRKDVKGALTDLDRALAAKPDFADGYDLRAKIRIRSGQRPAALEDLTRLTELQPRNPYGWAQRAKLLRNMGRLAEARKDYDRTLELAPDQAKALGARGAVLLQLGHVDAALSDFRRYCKLVPRDHQGWINLAIGLKRKGDKQGAITALEQAKLCAPASLRPQIDAEMKKLGK